MRVATLILGIGLGLFFSLVGFIAQAANLDELRADNATNWSTATFWLLPLIYLIAVAFVLHFPTVSMVAFICAAALSISAAIAVDTAAFYGGVQVLWAIASLALALTSFLGRGDTRRRQREMERWQQHQWAQYRERRQ